LSGIEKFKGERENFIFNTFIYFEPVKRFKNRSGVTKFRSSDDSTSKGVLDVLKTVKLKLRKIIVERVTVVKFGVNDGSCDEAGCFGIQKRTNAS